MKEKLSALSRQLPTSSLEQLASLPSFEERNRILCSLFEEIKILLTENGVQVNTEDSTYRVKTDERIQAKIARRGSDDPILDLYGLRFILDAAFKQRAATIIMQNYPTPEVFPWGKPSFRDYSEEDVRKNFIKQFNQNILSSYTAIHIDILFGNCQVAEIAEVQLMTKEELELAERMWPEYIAAQERMTQT